MRIYAFEYVRSAVGTTVREVCRRRLVVDTPTGRESTAASSDLLKPYVQQLWNDIYSTSLPSFEQLPDLILLPYQCLVIYSRRTCLLRHSVLSSINEIRTTQ